MESINRRDILITGLQSWDIGIGSNCKNIATEFSKHNRVLYVNPPTDRFTRIRRKLKGEKHSATDNSGQYEVIRQINKNLWVLNPQITIESISQLPIDFLFDLLNKINNRRFANEIKKALRYFKFKNIIHFCDSDMFRSQYLKEFILPSLSIYYSRDNLLAVKYWQKQGTRIEPKTMAKADLVLTNSTFLASIARKHNKNAHFVGQGCDTNAFHCSSSNEVPEDIQNISNPIIGYIGALNSLRLDVKLLEEIAAYNQKWNFVFVGPEDEQFNASKLHYLQNVHFLGSKPEANLPAYLNRFDVAINPQKINQVTIGNYPRKIDEYLSMGKPTVATKTEAMQYFKEYVSLASNISEWTHSIQSELKNDSALKQQNRIEFAKTHTWENNVREIYKKISDLERSNFLNLSKSLTA